MSYMNLYDIIDIISWYPKRYAVLIPALQFIPAFLPQFSGTRSTDFRPACATFAQLGWVDLFCRMVMTPVEGTSRCQKAMPSEAECQCKNEVYNILQLIFDHFSLRKN